VWRGRLCFSALRLVERLSCSSPNKGREESRPGRQSARQSACATVLSRFYDSFVVPWFDYEEPL
jgi:hypothetical protein